VENQLYSLSAALGLLDSRRTFDSDSYASYIGQSASSSPRLRPTRNYKSNDILGLMIQNCERTLEHLESIVEKYSTFRCESVPSEPPTENLGAKKTPPRRWRRELRENWKKIIWTTEGGDLATLRNQLTVHTNCVNLVVGVISTYFSQ
jgi:hypothetical protein